MSRDLQVSVVLICEQAQQVTGSGCCGKLRGDPALTGTARAFSQVRQQREEIGLLYRTVRRLFSREMDQGRLVVVAVDPRNQLYLVPRLWVDVWRHRPGWRAGLWTVFQVFSLPAVIVNGRVIGTGGRLPTPDEMCHVLRTLLDRDLVAPDS
jgi:hypothetical protein